MLNPFPAVIVHPRSVSQQGDGPKQILGRHLEATDTSCIMLHGFGLESLSNTHIYIYIYIYTYTVQFMRTVLWNLNLMHCGHVGWCTSYQLCQGNFLPRLNKDEYAAMWIVIPFDCVWFCLLKCPLPCAAVVSSMWQPKNWHYRSMQVWAPSKCIRCANAETEIKCLYLMFCRTQPRPI